MLEYPLALCKHVSAPVLVDVEPLPLCCALPGALRPQTNRPTASSASTKANVERLAAPSSVSRTMEWGVYTIVDLANRAVVDRVPWMTHHPFEV